MRMTRRASGFTLSFLLFGVLSACGAGEAEPDAGSVVSCTKSQALQTLTSQTGAYTFYVCDAATPARGFNTFSYLVVDKSGSPVDGLTFTVEPWMPDMNHGSPGTPAVAAYGDGLYQVSNVVFTMAGLWQLRTAVSAPTSDSANPQFNID